MVGNVAELHEVGVDIDFAALRGVTERFRNLVILDSKVARFIVHLGPFVDIICWEIT